MNCENFINESLLAIAHVARLTTVTQDNMAITFIMKITAGTDGNMHFSNLEDVLSISLSTSVYPN